MYSLDLEKAEESEIKLPTSAGTSKKQESSRKTSTSALLYAGQEATVINGHGKKKFLIKKKKRNGHGTTDGFQIGKGVHQGCMLLPCLFNLYAEIIMRNAGLDEAHAGIKIAESNINNLRYADDTTFMTESEELKSLLMKV